MFLHCWADLAAEHSDVRICAVMCCRRQIFPPSPSCYQLIYVSVQCLSCAKMETVGSCTRTHMQVILNRPKHDIMSSGPRGSMLGLPTATQLLCSQDGSFMLSLRVLTTRLLSPAAESQTWGLSLGEKKKCPDTHIFPGDKSNKVLPQQDAKLFETSCNHDQILLLHCLGQNHLSVWINDETIRKISGASDEGCLFTQSCFWSVIHLEVWNLVVLQDFLSGGQLRECLDSV